MIIPNSDFTPTTVNGPTSEIKYRIFLENISREDVEKLNKKLTSLNYISLNYNDKRVDYDITMRVVLPGSTLVSTPLLGYETGLYRVTPIERKQGFISYLDIYSDIMLYDLAVKELLVEYLI